MFMHTHNFLNIVDIHEIRKNMKFPRMTIEELPIVFFQIWPVEYSRIKINKDN